MATFNEIEEAVQAVIDAGGTELALLHCISGYPTPIEDCNLRTMVDMQQRFSVPIGLSDHTIDNTAAVTATALGAAIIEKHFVIDRSDGSVDAAFSLEPKQFAELVSQCRRAHSALGQSGYDIKPSENGARDLRRSLYVTADINKGDLFTIQNVRSVRPAKGLHTRYLQDILGKVALQDMDFGTPLEANHISDFNTQ
jgi:N-acetylneuraminate synthase